jgi:flagellar protein FliL
LARGASSIHYTLAIGAAANGDKSMASKPKKVDKEKPEADDEEDGTEAEQASKAKRKLPLPRLKTIIIAVVGLIVLAGSVTGAYFMFAGGKGGAVAAAPTKPPAFVDVPEVLVNLSNVGADRTQYLKVKIVLEIPDAALTAQIESTMPRVMDAFQTYLRELRPTDLDGSAGLYRLKEELTRRVNSAIAPSRITAVLFKEIVVQ